MVLLREGDGNLELLAGGVAGYLLLKAGDKLVGAQHQGVLLPLAAGEGHPVQKALKVDLGGVPLGGGAVVHVDQAAVAVGHPVQLPLDLPVLHSAVGAHPLQALVVAQRNLGADRDLGHKGVALAVYLLELHVGPVHRLQAGLLQGLVVGVGIGHVDGVLVEVLLAHHLHHHGPGGLALAEAGDGELLDVLLIGAVHALLELAALHADLQLVKVGFDLVGPQQFHVTSSRC